MCIHVEKLATAEYIFAASIFCPQNLTDSREMNTNLRCNLSVAQALLVQVNDFFAQQSFMCFQLVTYCLLWNRHVEALFVPS
jgi:hypothetical protein